MGLSSLFGRRWARDKVVVITGAGSGIGRATAHAFARQGARVHVVDIHEARAQEVASAVRQLDAPAHAHAVDVRDPDAVEALAEEVYRRHGRCDILVNNAGVAHSALVQETSLEDWRRVIDTNLWGVIHGIHAFVPRMIDQGGRAHIVNTASVAGLVAMPAMAPYCASKFAVVGLSESLGAELSAHDIKVTAVCPGIIATDIIRAAHINGALADQKRSVVDFYAKRGIPPERVARDILQAVRKGAPYANTWGSAYPAVLLHRVSPRLFRRMSGMMLSRVMGERS
jgi:NAD(P)-dependent dehydrogenase (short-subunit alcohol dehydrogenase family)